MPTYLHKCLGKKGYTIAKAHLDKREERMIIKELTVKPMVLAAYKEFCKPKPYKIYKHVKDFYFLPRYFGYEKFGKPKYTTLPKGKDINFNCTAVPMEHQKAAWTKIQEIYNLKNQLGGGGVLSLPCGYGKTIIAIMTMRYIGKKTIVVVNKEVLMKQWVDAIRRFTDASVGILQRDKAEMDNDIVVAMIHSLSMKEYPESMFNDIGFSIFDEVHHTSSDTFSKALMKVQSRFALGLSATPERRDGLSHVFYKFLGPLFHREKRTGANRITVKQIAIQSTSTHYNELFMSNGTKNTAGMATQISQFEMKNILTILILKLLVAQGRKILVLSSRRGHLEDLKSKLDEANLITSGNRYATYGLYYGNKGQNKKMHAEMLEVSSKCDIILGTDAIAKEGLDIPDLNTLVFSTPPGEDVEQAVGRILRKFHKDVHPVVVDLVDKTGNFPKHARTRNKWYTEEDYDIQNLKVQLYDEDKLNKWDLPVTDFINKKEGKKNLKTLNIKKIPDEPDLDQCHLDTDTVKVPASTSTSISIKKKPKKKAFVLRRPDKTKEEPPESLCLV